MRAKAIAPLLIFCALAAALWIGLSLKPAEVPSAMIGKPAPEFTLPALDGGDGVSAALLREPGVKVVNVWASWCAPCRVEHPQLMALAELPGVSLVGINYKDKPEAARAFLAGLGNPFDAVGVDRTGRASIEWGVYGVPETFIVDGRGHIAHRHVGVIMEHDLRETLIPLIERLGAAQ